MKSASAAPFSPARPSRRFLKKSAAFFRPKAERSSGHCTFIKPPPSLSQLYLRPTADPHLQRHRPGQVKIRIAAEPALAAIQEQMLFSRCEYRAALPGPHTSARLRRRQAVLPVTICCTLVLHHQFPFLHPILTASDFHVILIIQIVCMLNDSCSKFDLICEKIPKLL